MELVVHIMAPIMACEDEKTRVEISMFNAWWHTDSQMQLLINNNLLGSTVTNMAVPPKEQVPPATLVLCQ